MFLFNLLIKMLVARAGSLAEAEEESPVIVARKEFVKIKKRQRHHSTTSALTK